MKIHGYFDYDQPDMWWEDDRPAGKDGFDVPDEVWETYQKGLGALAIIEELYNRAYLENPKRFA